MKITRTTLVIRILLFVGTFTSMFFVPWIIVKAWLMPLPDTVQEQLTDAISYGFDGMVVYVHKAGEPPALYSAGYKDRKNKVPADPTSLFKIASISKLYVSVAATKLIQANRLSLDNSLADYFPELVGRIENAETITLRLMIQHRSGIPNYTDTPAYWDAPPVNNNEKLELALDLPASFEPGASYEYSNTNYLLLAELIKKVVGYSHHQFIKEQILTPLGLKNTFGSLSEVNINDVMGGYYVGVEQDIKTNDYGSMLATVEDVGIFLRALNDGSVFNEGEKEIYSSIYVYEHGGLIPGYQSLAKYHPDIDTVVVQVMNTTDFNGYNWNLSQVFYNRIVEIVRNNQVN